MGKESGENEKDGRIILTFYNNNMEARGDFFPPYENGLPINPDYMRNVFDNSKIVYGLQQDDISEAYRACVEDQEIVRDVLVAKGDIPFDEVPEYMQINPYLGLNSEEEEEEEGGSKVDHRARSAFTIVKKGQALAKLKHLKPGRNGTDVFGTPVPFKVTKPEGVSGGENTRMEGRFLISNINGQLIQTKSTLSVMENLVIKGAVGYKTGNIVFPGDVEIDGQVSDGFKIYSGGSVTMKQTFDVTDAVIKYDLNVGGGIIGRGQAMIKAGGNLRTKFIENCHVAVRKKIAVETEIIHSRIFTLEALEMGEKGKIVGSEIHAVSGVRAGSIGRAGSKAVKIHCGVDFTLEQEKERYNSILRALAAKLQRLKELINDPSTDEEKKTKMKNILEKLLEEQQKAQGRVMDLLGKVNVNEDATVEAIGEIATGTLIEICQIALFTTEPLKKVKIRLGRESQKLIVEKM